MHNNIMAAGSKDRPPMLGPGRYSQWRSRFLRYLDTKSNGEYLRKCIFEDNNTHDNREQTFTSSEKDSYFLILRWKFTSRDGESMESYYSRFYKLMNELTRNNLQVSPMQAVDVSEAVSKQVNDIVLRISQKCKSLHSLAATSSIFSILLSGTKPSKDEWNHHTCNLLPHDHEDSNPEQAQRDKDMKKNLALLAKFSEDCTKSYKTNLRTSSNYKNMNEDYNTKCNKMGYSALTAMDLDTMPGNAGSIAGNSKEKSKVISDLKVKEGKDIDTDD
ncbi:hypothetical protein Tco_0216474 [Tanacetum coccineum]